MYCTGASFCAYYVTYCVTFSDESITLLRDGNFGFYPLVQNSSHAYIEPRWFDLVPVQSIAAHTEPLATLGSTHSKSKITVLAIALQVKR
jgi:hypothetical protein